MGINLAGKQVAVLGAGKMGSILLQALLREGLLARETTRATVAHPDRARALQEKLQVKVLTSNAEAVRNADIIFLCVKPQVVQEVIEEIRDQITPAQLLISVAASVPTSQIEAVLGKPVPVAVSYTHLTLPTIYSV